MNITYMAPSKKDVKWYKIRLVEYCVGCQKRLQELFKFTLSRTNNKQI